MICHPLVSVGLIFLAVTGLLLALLIPWWVVALLGGTTAVLSHLAMRWIVRSLPPQQSVGVETLPGSLAVVIARSPETAACPYVVRLEGELWSAWSAEELSVGKHALVLEVERNHLVVCRMPPELESP